MESPVIYSDGRRVSTAPFQVQTPASHYHSKERPSPSRIVAYQPNSSDVKFKKMRGKGYPPNRRPHQLMNAGRACQCVAAVTHSSHGHCISFKLIFNTITTLSRQADRKISHSTLAATFLSHDSADPRSLRSFYFWTRSLAGDVQDTTVPHVSRGGRVRARVQV